RPFFKIGIILPITPIFSENSKSKNIFRKIYAIFIFVLYFMGFVISLHFRNYYQDFFLMKKVFFYLDDIFVLCMDFCAIIGNNFWKKPKWTHFLEKLEISQ